MLVLCYSYLRLNDVISAMHPQYAEYFFLKTALNMTGSSSYLQYGVALWMRSK